MTKRKVRTDVTLDEAHAIVNAARDAEAKAKSDAIRAEFVGTFLKYRNSSGSGKKWWMYMAVTDVEPYMAAATGWTFQRYSTGEIQIELKARHYVAGGGWQKISASEFWRAAESLHAVVTDRLRGRS